MGEVCSDTLRKDGCLYANGMRTSDQRDFPAADASPRPAPDPPREFGGCVDDRLNWIGDVSGAKHLELFDLVRSLFRSLPAEQSATPTRGPIPREAATGRSIGIPPFHAAQDGVPSPRSNRQAYSREAIHPTIPPRGMVGSDAVLRHPPYPAPIGSSRHRVGAGRGGSFDCLQSVDLFSTSTPLLLSSTSLATMFLFFVLFFFVSVLSVSFAAYYCVCVTLSFIS